MPDFETAPVGTTAELERVKQDRDEWKQASRDRRRERDSCAARLDYCAARLAGVRGQLDAALEREQALAAHIQLLRQTLNDQLNDCINFDDGNLTDFVQARSAQVLKQTPATSLARRDLSKQAEEADYIADSIEWGLRDRAKYLRQQATQLENEHDRTVQT